MNKTQDQKQCIRRSLKLRVKKMMRLTNFISVALFSFVLLIFFFITLSILGTSYSNYTASQMSIGIGQYMALGDSNELHEYLVKLNPDDGNFARLNRSSSKLDPSHFNLHQIFNNTMNIVSINAVEFRVWQGDTPIYQSFDPAAENFINTMLITDLFANEVSKDITDQDGKVIGRVAVRLSPMILVSLLAIIAILGIFLLIINSFVSHILTMILSSLVIKPLTRLNDELSKIANGNIESSIHQEIIVKKPVIEVQNLITSSNQILFKMNEYASLMNAQKDELESQTTELEAQTEELEAQTEELESQKDELEAQNATLEERSTSLKFINAAYINRTLKLQNLLNNVGQGFLTINKDQIINPEYSYECEKMILTSTVKKINGMKITETLFADSNQEDFIEELFQKIFDSPHNQKELFFSLLPEELTLNNRILSIAYKLVNDDQQEEVILIILTDITHTRNLERQMDEERNNLKMIVKVLLNREEFIDVISDYKEFTKKDFKHLAITQKEEILREIHTYKGVFSQYYLENIAAYLNELENKLYNDENLEQFHCLNGKDLVKSLEYDMKTIESYIGEEFLYGEDIYTIKEEKILEIENRLKSALSPSEYLKILPIVKSIRHKSIKELLKTYPDYTIKLSERFSKSIHPFAIEGDDVYIDHLAYQGFSKTLIHMFRNCVDHGIETEDERIELNKSQIATIHCEVNKLNDGFEILICDDGRGIDPKKLLESALCKGLIHQEDISHMNDSDILNLIFLDGLTTNETVSAISGRGVGLAAVKETVDLLNGRITVKTELNVGTEFKIWLPNIQISTQPNTSPQRLLQHIVDVSGNIFKTLNLKICDYKLIQTDKITLNKISALISIKGSIDAILIISIDDKLGKELVSAFMIEEVDASQIDNYIEDVLGEISNTILGNVLGRFEEDGVYLSIGVPAMISNKDAYVKYTDSQIYSIVYERDKCSLIMSLLLLDPDHHCTHEGSDSFQCIFEDSSIDESSDSSLSEYTQDL